VYERNSAKIICWVSFRIKSLTKWLFYVDWVKRSETRRVRAGSIQPWRNRDFRLIVNYMT